MAVIHGAAVRVQMRGLDVTQENHGACEWSGTMTMARDPAAAHLRSTRCRRNGGGKIQSRSEVAGVAQGTSNASPEEPSHAYREQNGIERPRGVMRDHSAAIRSMVGVPQLSHSASRRAWLTE